jgi:hypothetical protein
VSNTRGVPEGRSKPPPQQNLDAALKAAFVAVASQPAEQMVWLGAQRTGSAWRLPVLSDAFDVDLDANRVTASAGRPVGPHWAILALHYLAIAARPERLAPEITFADLPTARSYSEVYRARTVARLCATVGRDAEGLRIAATGLGASSVAGGDATFQFDVFPQLTVRLVWHAPDEEFPPSATLLLPRNVESYFCAEDVVVLSERLVARLAGKPF